MQSETSIPKRLYLGTFVVGLTTLMYEILLTRIFSVTMWYHFAFVAISIAMFGMTLGALIVYLRSSYFSRDRIYGTLPLSCLLFSVTVLVSFLLHLRIPFITTKSVLNLFFVVLTYIIIAIPFVFSGITICLVLTKFPRQVSKLYAADLTGAALGCILLVFTLKITDGPTAVIIVACIASLSGVLFCSDKSPKRLKGVAVLTTLLLAAFAVSHMILVNSEAPLLKLIWVKGEHESRPLYEKWNSFSRIKVSGDPNQPERPFGWGLSAVYPQNKTVRQLYLNIDANAGTMLTAFDGDLTRLEHLKYDITNIVHYIRPASRVLVVGTGGGRDILSALAFKQRSVLGVEINQDIIKAVNQRFGDFTGHLDSNPQVSFVNDEARSYIARQREQFDIIQVSLIDTWAATAAGAFVLAENSLYTVEAWKILLNGLTPTGVLTFSRWYSVNQPREMYRLTSLACAALKGTGIENPRDHIIIVRSIRQEEPWAGVGTMLVCKHPFSATDVEIIENISHQMQFDRVLMPTFAVDSAFLSIVTSKDPRALTNHFPIRVDPPTDDNPFFFHMLRFRDMTQRALWKHWWTDPNMIAVFILGGLLVFVIVLTVFFILIPLSLTLKEHRHKHALPLLAFFACIGLGFMLVEISQMQRLIIFLGHPTYALSVVLFALLVSSGLGSYYTKRLDYSNPSKHVLATLTFLLITLALFGRITPPVIHTFESSTTPVRILLAIAILLPLGFSMGMAFPLGIKLIPPSETSLTPWLWGINGATSVCASVLAVVIAMNSGISSSFWSGFLCYVVGSIALMALARRTKLPSEATGR